MCRFKRGVSILLAILRHPGHRKLEAYATFRKLEAYATFRKLEAYATFRKLEAYATAARTLNSI
ncbi:hypothetical protein CKO51_00960 [Rhodopirellula sp. SM50]|nr:hypothetical protein CKO51_00960 [Rhodopirellula sp. SM50]